MLKSIKAFLLSVLTIGSLVATGNMAKSQETKVAEAATKPYFRIYFHTNSWGNISHVWINDVEMKTNSTSTTTLGTWVLDISQNGDESSWDAISGPDFQQDENGTFYYHPTNDKNYSNTNPNIDADHTTNFAPFLMGHAYVIKINAYGTKVGTDAYYSYTIVDKGFISCVPNSKTITFKSNGGTFTDGTQTKSSVAVSTPSSLPKLNSRFGYAFQGWSTSATTFTEPLGYSLTAATLYAHWVKTKTVYLDVNSKWDNTDADYHAYCYSSPVAGSINSEIDSFGSFPGKVATPISDGSKKYYQFNDAPIGFYIIFNNGNQNIKSNKRQTEDLVISETKNLYVLSIGGSTTLDGTITKANGYWSSTIYKTPTERVEEAKTTAISSINAAKEKIEKYENYNITDASLKNNQVIGKSNREQIKSEVEVAANDVKNAVSTYVSAGGKEADLEAYTSEFETLENLIRNKIDKSNVKVYAQSQLDNGNFSVRFWGTVDDLTQEEPQYSALGFKIAAKANSRSVEQVINIYSIYTSVTYNGKDGETTLTTSDFDTAGFFLYVLTDIPSDKSEQIEFEVTPFAKRVDQELEDKDYGLKQTFKFVDGEIQRIV